MRLLAVTLLAFSFTLLGCNGGADDPIANACEAAVAAGGSGVACEKNAQCGLNEFCDSFCCAPLTVCTPTSCESGKFCDDTGSCSTVGQKCGGVVCECHILNGAGELAASGDPAVSLPAGSHFPIFAVLAETGGAPLPGAEFELNLPANGSFTLSDSGDEIVASATAGVATLSASPHGAPDVTCKVEFKNLGAGSGVTFHVFDDATGTPITGAQLVIDTSVPPDGHGDITAIEDVSGSADGQYVSSGLSGVYTVSVFAPSYNYMSLVGVDVADGADVAMPLLGRPTLPSDEVVGGFTGRLGFENYEHYFLSGVAKSIKFGIVGSSFPLRSLLNFDLALFMGDFDADLDCTAIPAPAGCYPMEIAGGVLDTVAPLPGGIILGLANSAVKEHFDIIARPGRRYAWALGGEIEVPDIKPLIDSLSPFTGCDCDVTADSCDAACECDSDCPDGPQINFGQIFNDIVPLFVSFASGVQGNIPVGASSKTAWNDYISDGYGVARAPDPHPDFSKLDTGSAFNELELRQGLTTFTNFAVPDLPNDPHPSVDGAMEGMLLITGVNARGFGFVPLGIGAGLDCTVGDCLDRTGNSDGFNGRVNGGTMCTFDPDPAKNGCPPGVPEKTTDGHVGLFSATPFGGLEGEQPMTIALALPLSSITDGPLRATAFLVHEAPAGGDVTLSGTYPAAPVLTGMTGRRFTATASGDMQWVTFATGATDERSSARWNVFFGAAGGEFVAPAVPTSGTWDDPAAAQTVDGHEVVNVTHAVFRIPQAAWNGYGHLAAHNGTTVANVAQLIDGFAVTTDDVPWTAP